MQPSPEILITAIGEVPQLVGWAQIILYYHRYNDHPTKYTHSFN